MKRALPVLSLALLLCVPAWARDIPINGTAEVFFSPHGGCTDAAVAAIGKAKTSVLVQAYSFTSRPIEAALIAAHARGVTVQVVADGSDETGKGSITHDLKAAGIEVVYDEMHVIAHNKVMVIDAGQPGATVVTGSFNFTHAAQYDNAENLLLLRGNAPLVEAYLANWKRHREHSRPYRR